MENKLTPRVCKHCGKAKQTIAFAYQRKDGSMTSVFCHLKCFRKFLKEN